jgi:hypothetical protein
MYLHTSYVQFEHTTDRTTSFQMLLYDWTSKYKSLLSFSDFSRQCIHPRQNTRNQHAEFYVLNDGTEV